MLVSDFKKRICNIDNHLYVEVGDGLPAMIKVKYSLIDDDPLPVLLIGLSGDLNTCTNGFELLSNKSKRKLLLAGIDMAMTPLHKRVEHKWNVIVGNDSSRFDSVVCWIKSDSDFPYLLCFSHPSDPSDPIPLDCDDAIFTDEEFSDLIKYIKTLPDGEWQAKVAEHGKTEAKK